MHNRVKWIIVGTIVIMIGITGMVFSDDVVQTFKFEMNKLTSNNNSKAGYENSPDRPEAVSLISLISTPEKYDDLYVRVIGVGQNEFEGHGLYLTKEHLKNGVSRNALWLSFNGSEVAVELPKYNGKYVIVEGVFNMNSNGHMGLYSGEIKDITRYELWSDEDD